MIDPSLRAESFLAAFWPRSGGKIVPYEKVKKALTAEFGQLVSQLPDNEVIKAKLTGIKALRASAIHNYEIGCPISAESALERAAELIKELGLEAR